MVQSSPNFLLFCIHDLMDLCLPRVKSPSLHLKEHSEIKVSLSAKMFAITEPKSRTHKVSKARFLS